MEGRPRDRLARRGPGRRHRRVRDAQHPPHHHRQGAAGRQAGPCKGTHALRPRLLRRGHARERCRARRAGALARLLRRQGVHGRLHRGPPDPRRRGRGGGAARHQPARGLPFGRRSQAGRTAAAGAGRRLDQPSRSAGRGGRGPLDPPAARHRPEAGQARAHPARDHRRGGRDHRGPPRLCDHGGQSPAPDLCGARDL